MTFREAVKVHASICEEQFALADQWRATTWWRIFKKHRLLQAFLAKCRERDAVFLESQRLYREEAL